MLGKQGVILAVDLAIAAPNLYRPPPTPPPLLYTPLLLSHLISAVLSPNPRFRVIAGETWVDSLETSTEEGNLNIQVS
jgi:hypothetical protein